MRLHVVHHGIRRRRARRRLVLWTGGEVLVTVGVLLLLLVVHQLWWTNWEARAGAERKVEAMEREWGAGAADIHSGIRSGDGDSGDTSDDNGHDDGTRDSHEAHDDQDARTSSSPPRWSQAYAILTIPRLDLRVPVAEGIGKPSVLNKGYVGHYPGTQQPGRAGNFALAGHRNTHGEPFRYINRLARGDTVQVETKSAVYTYAVDKTLPRTSARDAGVLRPVPRSTARPSYGYRDPGYYLTLTTCTPEYTSRYRLVVWGRLVSMRPR
ncbi:class E sortase [Streptomyces sp. HUCO-GS316]|uniref:class E sortase n=1 Tax=Streptomyces sp. HUCO-GS316 TaxID=2692198 RepID=UPI00136BA034|nr:class E sortase [Streptomyces sp. HUCO-GS316]MXM63347.1 class E sortase [Streptomyces sp. HUCO-GS316]